MVDNFLKLSLELIIFISMPENKLISYNVQLLLSKIITHK